MSYLLPCRPLQQQITVLVAQRVVRPLQIIAVRHNKTRRKIAGLYHMIAFRFQIFHEKTLPTHFSASARSSRKSSSPLRRLVSNHQFNWWFIISPPKGYCYCSPQRAVSQALLLARYKAVLLESSRLDSSACSFIYF